LLLAYVLVPFFYLRHQRIAIELVKTMCHCRCPSGSGDAAAHRAGRLCQQCVWRGRCSL